MSENAQSTWSQMIPSLKSSMSHAKNENPEYQKIAMLMVITENLQKRLDAKIKLKY